MKPRWTLFLYLLLLTGCAGLTTTAPERTVRSAASTPLIVDTAPETAVDSTPEEEETAAPPAGGMMGEEGVERGMMGGSPMSGAMAAPAGASANSPAPPPLDGLTGAERAIALLANEPAVARFLAGYPDWSGEAWADDGDPDRYYVDLYSEMAQEWLGWGEVDVAADVVDDYFVPAPLEEAQYQEQLARVIAFIDGDLEVQARLGAGDWERYIDFSRWDQLWYVWYEQGLDALQVAIFIDGEEIWLEDIVDPNLFAEAEQAQLLRDMAVELAWESEAVWPAVEPHEDWRTYVTPQGEGRYVVAFAAADRTLISLLVDVDAWEILDVQR